MNDIELSSNLVPELIEGSAAKPLLPHELGHVVYYHSSVVCTLLCFEFALCSHPHSFDMVCVDASRWIHEVESMISNSVVGGPHVGVDCRSWRNPLLDYGQ